MITDIDLNIQSFLGINVISGDLIQREKQIKWPNFGIQSCSLITLLAIPWIKQIILKTQNLSDHNKINRFLYRT